MPSYIELDKNNNLPSSSGNGKIIFGIDNNGTVIVSDHNGNQFSTVGQSVLTSGVTANTITTNTISATTLYGDGSNLIVDPIYCARLTSRDYDGGLNNSSDNLVIGITYTITDYIANDDFSNVADVLSGTINTNGCVFRATGITPTNWSNGTTLTTTNNPNNIIAKNQLGFTPNWMAPSTGTYYFNFKDSVDYSKIFTKFTPTPDLTLNWGSYFTFNYNQFYYQDTSFNNGGGGFNGTVKTIVNLPNNQILVGGNFSYYDGNYCPYIIKLNEDGTINGDFFNNIGDGFNDSVLKIVVQPDGKILVGGYFNWYNGTSFSSYITRLNSDGTLDNSFNTNVGSICNSTVYSIVVQPDGKILVGGDFTNNFVRLNSNGTLDTTFNIGNGFNNTVRDIKLQSDGKILVCGYFDSYNLSYCGYGIARLNSNGEIDVSFKVNVGDGFNNHVLCIDIQEDNKILVGGYGFNNFNDIETSYSIARLNSDGTFDKSFNNGARNYNTGFNGVVYSIVAQSGGNILVGGDFTSYNNSDNNLSNTNYYVRLDKYGYVLQNAQVFNSAIYTITPLPYQKVLVGGDFTYYYDNNNDSSTNYIQKMYTGFDVVLFTQQYLDSGLSVYCLNNTEIEIKLCN